MWLGPLHLQMGALESTRQIGGYVWLWPLAGRAMGRAEVAEISERYTEAHLPRPGENGNSSHWTRIVKNRKAWRMRNSSRAIQRHWTRIVKNRNAGGRGTAAELFNDTEPESWGWREDTAVCFIVNDSGQKPFAENCWTNVSHASPTSVWPQYGDGWQRLTVGRNRRATPCCPTAWNYAVVVHSQWSWTPAETRILQDAGCSTAVIRRDLVPDEALTGATKACVVVGRDWRGHTVLQGEDKSGLYSKAFV